MIRKLFNWIFKIELAKLSTEIKKAEAISVRLNRQHEIFDKVLSGIEVSVDVHEYERRANSWAVISLQGQKTDYIKFVDLGTKDVVEIGKFLRQFERNANIKVDASPQASEFLRIRR